MKKYFVLFILIQILYTLGWLLCNFGFLGNVGDTRRSRIFMYLALWPIYPIIWAATKCAGL